MSALFAPYLTQDARRPRRPERKVDEMNPRQVWTGNSPRLTAAGALSILLVSSMGCVGEDLQIDPSERPDPLEVDNAGVAYADAGAAHDLPGNAYADAGIAHDLPANAYADAGIAHDLPGNASCQAEPPKPGYADPDPGTDPEPRAGDAGAPGSGAGAPRNCFSTLIGDGKTCVSAADVKLEGLALCQAKGFELVDLKAPDSTDCAGGVTEGWVACCQPEAPAPAPACTGGVIGDGSACIDWTSLKLKASGACEASGASLVGLSGSSDGCPDGARWAKYECCKSDALPPKPANPDKDPWLK
jgi:hypothetical protein